MKTPIRILGIAGSLRRGSYNRAALRAATELVPEGAILETFELDGIPVFNQDEEQKPPAKVTDFKSKIREADAILFVTPEYNYSVPGVLKNAIDWLSRMTPQPFAAKPIAMFGASGGILGTARAQYQLRHIMVFLDGRPVNKPEVMIGAAQTRFVDGKLTDEATGKLLAELGASLVLAVRHARAIKEHVK